MTQLPVRKIAACFNNICFWRERKPLQWATFAHIQSGRTGVTTLLREVQAAEEGLERGAGTRCFSSSNQLRTTLSFAQHTRLSPDFATILRQSVGTRRFSSSKKFSTSTTRKSSLFSTIRKRPSGATSYRW